MKQTVYDLAIVLILLTEKKKIVYKVKVNKSKAFGCE